jgi:hypothetical protein
MVPSKTNEIDENLANALVKSVLDCIDREYPHNQIYWLESDADLLPPRELMPIFYGCLDWHSAVHGHWLLIRLCRCFPQAEFQTAVRAAMAASFTVDKVRGEIAHLQRRPSFECPYGCVWLLQLTLELREWDDPQARAWLEIITPLETTIATNFARWLTNLEYPDRTGTRVAAAPELEELIVAKARQFYGADSPKRTLRERDYPARIEPLAYDFLSPSLAAADLLRRIFEPQAFSDWLMTYLPELAIEGKSPWQPIPITKPHDYMHSHFRGLNLSRAWMMAGIISGLPAGDVQIPGLQAAIDLHRHCGMDDVLCADYSSSHWLGTFAVYLATNRGIKV